MDFDNCVSTGYSKLRDTPPIKKDNSGNNTIIPRDIKKDGIRLPVCSCWFFAYLNTNIIAIIDAII